MNRIIINLLPALFIILAFGACKQATEPASDFNEADEKKAVWEAVETRFYTWRDNDLEGHMQVYHPDWRRWALNSRQLMKKEDFIGLWDTMKADEQVIDMELEPVEIRFYCNGEMAIAHFISTESLLWTGNARTNNDGGKVERGNVEKVVMRWSDVMVKEDGQWLYVGGHRDFGRLPEDE